MKNGTDGKRRQMPTRNQVISIASREEAKPSRFYRQDKKRWLRRVKVCLTASVASSQYLKNRGKVSFNITSEASHVYNLSGQKFTKNAKNCYFGRVFENLKIAVKQCYQTDRWKMSKLNNSNATFLVLFNQFAHLKIIRNPLEIQLFIHWNYQLKLLLNQNSLCS